MPAYLHQLATALPPHAYAQMDIAARVAAWLPLDPRGRRQLHALYARSDIRQRHSVLPHFLAPDAPADVRAPWTDELGTPRAPSTGWRNDTYEHTAAPLFVAAARAAVDTCPGVQAADVTHVITVSCTGFYNPGPDLQIVRALGLPSSTPRFHLGFMGCHAAFPALKLAAALCLADPRGTVLVVCVELCTLHAQLSSRADDLLAGCLFADGAAAAMVRGVPPAAGHTAYALGATHSEVLSDSAAAMSWRIADTGFRMTLSPEVPRLIGRHAAASVDAFLAAAGHTRAAIDGWAVHPGGRAILEQVASSLALPAARLQASYDVLAAHGNMSSATILFVLAALAAAPTPPTRLCAVAFGPGLTVELALLERVVGG